MAPGDTNVGSTHYWLSLIIRQATASAWITAPRERAEERRNFPSVLRKGGTFGRAAGIRVWRGIRWHTPRLPLA